MRFALLGAEPDVMSLLEVIRDSSQHTLVATYETSDAPDLDLDEMFGVLPSDDGWESLLLGSVADAVIVCRCQDADRRADQLRKLTQAAIPLIVIHPVGTVILAFELQMIGQDSGGVIVPYQPGLDHPIFQEMRCSESIKQVSVERRMADASAVAAGEQFARDALIIRQLVGRIEQLSALEASQDHSDDVNLSVQMSAENGSIARWVMLPASEGTATQWTVYTEQGTTTAVMPDNGDWTVMGKNPVNERNATTAGQAAHIAHITLDRLAGRQAGTTMPGADWHDACRAIELFENVGISKRRGKTVQLHYADISEENTFKSLMTASGCLILLLLVFLLPMLATVETLLLPAVERPVAGGVEPDASPRPSSSSPFLESEAKNVAERSWFGIWPVLLFCFLAFFLCLQFLRLATKSAKSQGEQSARPSQSK